MHEEHEAAEVDWRVVFERGTHSECSDRALVLTSLDIPHRIIERDGHCALITPTAFAERAKYELWQYTEENRARPAPPPPVTVHRHDALPGVLVYIGAIGLFAWLAGEAAFGRDWLAAGRIDGRLLREGELWRPFTALTLHLNLKHLLGNMGFGALFGLFRRAAGWQRGRLADHRRGGGARERTQHVAAGCESSLHRRINGRIRGVGPDLRVCLARQTDGAGSLAVSSRPGRGRHGVAGLHGHRQRKHGRGRAPGRLRVRFCGRHAVDLRRTATGQCTAAVRHCGRRRKPDRRQLDDRARLRTDVGRHPLRLDVSADGYLFGGDGRYTAAGSVTAGASTGLKKLFLFLVILGAAGAAVLKLRYGEGSPYPAMSGSPLLAEDALELVLEYPEPVGNVAVSADDRLFFTVHPEARPRGNKLLEWVDGAAVPYPSGAEQPALFDTVLGIAIDRQDRLWTIDHGNHGFRRARLIAIDLATGNVVLNQPLAADIAPTGSMLQDLQVSADGQHVIIADASIWRQAPALIVYSVASGTARRALESHDSVMPEDYVIRTPGQTMSYLGGLVSLKSGVDGIALDPENEWLYYAAINNSGLFRVPLNALLNPELPDRQLAALVERVSDKPLSDGLSADLDGNVFVTDVEHGAIHRVTAAGERSTLLKSPQIRWADGLSFGPDGWLYLADSAIPDLVLKSSEHIRAAGPYRIFRFKPGTRGVAGH